ncbi:hypothetical protein HanIR_Chr02g0086191 [Helianthus annuus]|nr:hypothetical protein HanIR_Chr02g0086191 [Helianthus annuus]
MMMMLKNDDDWTVLVESGDGGESPAAAEGPAGSNGCGDGSVVNFSPWFSPFGTKHRCHVRVRVHYRNFLSSRSMLLRN